MDAVMLHASGCRLPLPQQLALGNWPSSNNVVILVQVADAHVENSRQLRLSAGHARSRCPFADFAWNEKLGRILCKFAFPKRLNRRRPL
jgi:hypothetical protein